MDTIIKIDYKALCKGIIDDTKTIYGLYDKDVENLPLHLPTILKWQEKIQDDHIINELKKDNIEYVAKLWGYKDAN